MFSNVFRTVAGYSRLALQKDRRHEAYSGYLFPNNAPLPNNMLSFPLSFNTMNILQSGLSNPMRWSRPNLLDGVYSSDAARIEKLIISQQTKNQIYSIQYQANNGIEDRLVKATLPSINAEIVCVFDGHGGDKLSEYCANHIVDYVDKFIQENKQKYSNDLDKLISDSLKWFYKQIDQNFYENVYQTTKIHTKKIKNVGTCALTVVIWNKKIYVANCGDSQAIVVSEDSDKMTKYQQLNERLSVSNPKERQRLRKQFPNDKDIIEEINGCLYVKGRLQPTSALGDYFLKFSHLSKQKENFNGPYITNEPAITIFPIKSNYKTIVVASDGIWDFVEKQIVAESSLKQNPHEQILKQTMRSIAQMHKKSVQQIKQVNPKQKRDYHDDISIIVVSLNQNFTRDVSN